MRTQILLLAALGSLLAVPPAAEVPRPMAAVPSIDPITAGGPDEIERDVNHEFGHILYAGLSPQNLRLWKIVWQTVIDLGVQPVQKYVDADGQVKNYFEVNDMEGFCVAWSYIQTGQPVDSAITNFFNGLPK